MNTVRRIVLRKGGKYVTIVTYGLFGYTSRYTTKHLSQVTSNYFRLKPVMNLQTSSLQTK